jgi:hypothetical protein
VCFIPISIALEINLLILVHRLPLKMLNNLIVFAIVLLQLSVHVENQ